MKYPNRKPIIYLDWITRDMLKARPDDIFVFGDNCLRKGMGGQAAEMRGEPNAFGIVTKKSPDMYPESFFSDHNPDDSIAVCDDLIRLHVQYLAGKQIYAPTNGLGTERAMLKEKAPKLFRLIIGSFAEMSDPHNFPWAKL